VILWFRCQQDEEEKLRYKLTVLSSQGTIYIVESMADERTPYRVNSRSVSFDPLLFAFLDIQLCVFHPCLP
jgi:hypothetical protein